MSKLQGTHEIDKHQFSLYCDASIVNIEPRLVGNAVVLHDSDLVHRISHVLRLRKGETVTLFNRMYHAKSVICADAARRKIKLEILHCEENKILSPPVTFLLPLLKREAFEASLYSLGELGVTNIVPISTKKAQLISKYTKLHERMQRILISAAEQSKLFAFPQLDTIRSFSSMLSTVVKSKDPKIFFDPSGDLVVDVIFPLHTKNVEHVWCMVGPEGDLTSQEKDELKKIGFSFCSLTPTVLRASQAVALGAGILRSVL